ncbi:MAG: hypothetical protein V2J26_09395 [Pacificimonas sp.]|jgi:hypothetical protein|nr:hypothetical protein [Pacificimonas sp.]
MTIDRRHLLFGAATLPALAGLSACATSGVQVLATVAANKAREANDEALNAAERQREIIRKAQLGREAEAAADQTVNAILRERAAIDALILQGDC